MSITSDTFISPPVLSNILLFYNEHMQLKHFWTTDPKESAATLSAQDFFSDVHVLATICRLQLSTAKEPMLIERTRIREEFWPPFAQAGR
jgi:hypothetical protein